MSWISLILFFFYQTQIWKVDQMVDTLSRRHSLLHTMEVQVLGFEVLKELYNDDPDFGNVWKDFSKGSVNHFLK